MTYNLFCAIIGNGTAFPVAIKKTQTVIEGIAETAGSAQTLTLYQVNIDISTDEAYMQAMRKISQNTTCAQVIRDIHPNVADPEQEEFIRSMSGVRCLVRF